MIRAGPEPRTEGIKCWAPFYHAASTSGKFQSPEKSRTKQDKLYVFLWLTGESKSCRFCQKIHTHVTVIPRYLHFNIRLLEWGRKLKTEEMSDMESNSCCQRGRQVTMAMWSALQQLDSQFSSLLLQKPLEVRYPVRYSLRNRLSSGRAKVGDLLEHREEKRQLIPYPELSSEWTHGYNSVVMSNDDILLVFGIYNDPMGNSCPQMPSIFLWGLKTHCLPPPQTVSNFCVESQKISKNFKKWARSFTSWMFYHLQKFIYEAKLSQIYLKSKRYKAFEQNGWSQWTGVSYTFKKRLHSPRGHITSIQRVRVGLKGYLFVTCLIWVQIQGSVLKLKKTMLRHRNQMEELQEL